MKMKKKNTLFLVVILTGTIALLFPMAQATDLEAGFMDPADAMRPWVYWFFIDGNLSREGMTADLEAMKEAGIGGMIIMEVDVGIPRGPVAFMSDEWCALFKHAVEEAERLGLQITLNAGPGWTGSGGPWVKAEQSMQHLVASVTEVDGPSVFDAVLPVPEPRKPYFGERGLTPETTRAREEFYVDEVVLAIRRTNGLLLSDIDEKALYIREPYTSRPGIKPWLPAPAEYPEFPANAVVPVSEVLNLTDRLQLDGRLLWDVPKGPWTILRMGRRTTGANTRPAPQPGLGLESDKFDKVALEAHFDAFVGKLLRTLGPRPTDRSSGWTMLHIDSWEMGAQNWTAGFREEFQRRRGYDPTCYLPVMTGRVIGSVEISERFLWDLRLTAQEMVVENHAEHLKELGKRNGFGLSIEPYDMNPTSDMVLGGVADVPMCEFWAQGYGFDSSFTCIESTSIAHTFGRPIVAAEAFTAGSGEAWQLYPAAMKNQGDWAFCTGINRIVFHRYAHQPWLDRRPGMTMGPYGVHWDRTQTWWPMVFSYHRYLARCQFLLRQGMTVADICYLIPEGAPHVFRPPISALEGDLPDRRGYNFDGCTPGILLKATVDNGSILLPSGALYRLLVLPAFNTMTPTLLRKVQELVEAGATVIGPPPRKSPSLSAYPACDKTILSLATTLWGQLQPRPHVVARTVGRGQILWGGELAIPGADTPLALPIEDARWIWHPEDTPSVPPCKRYFRRSFILDASKRVSTACVLATADNNFLLYVNSKLTVKGSSFHELYEADADSLLVPGKNILTAQIGNEGDAPNPAGFIAVLHIEYEDGTFVDILTNKEWQVSKEVSTGWRISEMVDDSWVNAQDIGAFDRAPWNLKPVSNKVPELYPDYEATATILRDMKILPDFESNAAVRYTHRRISEGDIYFVANRLEKPIAASCLFRIKGKQPELWDPLSGIQYDLPEFSETDGRINIPLQFEPFQSFFIIFRKNISEEPEKKQTISNFSCIIKLDEIEGPWEVTFGTGLDESDPVEFETLQDWCDRSEPEIKYYSGIATYRKTFELPKNVSINEGRLLLDIGIVPGMARVRINDQDMGVLWCAPWQVDISNAVQEKKNKLEIEVANLWPNRLIGDKGLPQEEQYVWTTWNPYKINSPLLESGLKGPVKIMCKSTFP